MTQQTESDRLEGETQDANPGITGKAGDKPTSQNVEKPEVDLAELYQEVKSIGAVVKNLQSGKDRGVNRALTEVENMKGQIGRIMSLAEQGLDVDGIERELSKVPVEDQIAALAAKMDQLLGSGANGMASGPTAEQRTVISEIGLEESDPVVTRAIRNGLRGAELKAELAMAALAKAKRPSPGPSDAAPLSGGSAAAKDDFDVSGIEDSEQLYKIAAEKEFGS